jgi:single-stranded-DNA-specific exonuclease
MADIKFHSSSLLDQKTASADLLSLLLKNRSIKPPDQRSFLKPVHPDTLTAHDFKISPIHLKKAVQRIQKAIKDQEKILIYGDYDVDGLTATTILWETLQKQGAKIKSFVPHREKDGYGLNPKTLKRIFKTYRPDLLITVDNGIVAHAAATFLKKAQIDLIITDHHLPEDKLPFARAIIHSPLVCGATLSWFLACQFAPSDYGLVALGTVADCLPLLSINRSFVYHGLRSLSQSSRPGLLALKQAASLQNKELGVYDLAFIIGPRLNAAGRVGDPSTSLRLLASPNRTTAQKYAHLLEKQNKNRQDEQSWGLSQAQSIYQKQKDSLPLIFISSPNLNPGTIGLIAGRLTQDYYLPSVIISQTTPVAKASCRSIPHLNILKALRQADDDLLVDLGGHPAAAGFSILPKNIKKFQKKLTLVVAKMLKNKTIEPQVEVESRATLSFVNLKNYQTIQKLQPFGIGNPEPLFYFENLTIVDKQLLGQDKSHLKLLLDDPATPRTKNFPLESLSFGQAASYPDLAVSDTISLVAKLNLNEFRGHQKLQLIAQHIHVQNQKN